MQLHNGVFSSVIYALTKAISAHHYDVHKTVISQKLHQTFIPNNDTLFIITIVLV